MLTKLILIIQFVYEVVLCYSSSILRLFILSILLIIILIAIQYLKKRMINT